MILQIDQSTFVNMCKYKVSQDIFHSESKKCFKWFYLTKLAMLLVLFASITANANNIQIANVKLTGQDVGSGTNNTANFTYIAFDISWQNSWRTPTSSGLLNWDAAWVFAKFRKATNGVWGPWEHVRISQSGHITGSGTAATIQTELQNPTLSFNSTSNPVVGAFVYRSNVSSGVFSQNQLKLKWDYRRNNINDDEIVEVKVFAVEMVYIPGGAYDVGDGLQTALAGQLTSRGSHFPFRMNSEAALTLGGNTVGVMQNNNSSGMSTADDFNNSTSRTLPAAFPKGYQSFYMMKYEISQQQYVEFLNTLTRDNQNVRTATDLSINTTSVSNRFVMSGTSTVQNRNGIRCDANISATDPIVFYCDLNANGTGGESTDGQWLACNFLSWGDIATYLDWSGLRPMTELEFEKAARGHIFADSSQYAWGNNYAVAAAAISGGGQINEMVSTPLANVAFGNSLTGPLKVGAFSQNSFGRISSGSSYYGVMELSGNISEFCISIGNAGGRAFTGLHGDGMIATTFGIANTADWPSANAIGVGRRGGSWLDTMNQLRISDRSQINDNVDTRQNIGGGRGVRSVGCQLPTAMPGVVNGADFVGKFSQINFKTSGGSQYLWTVPAEVQLLTGQGSDSISAISPGSYAMQPLWNILVSIVNACGAGPERSRNFNVGHLSNFDSTFIFNNHRIYVFDKVGTRLVNVFENIDSVKVIAVGGGGNGTNTSNNWGGAGSGFVVIKNNLTVFKDSFTLRVGNSAESSFIRDFLVADEGENNQSNRGGNGGSGGGSSGGSSAYIGGSNGSNGSGPSPGLGNGYLLSDLNEIVSLFSAGVGGSGDSYSAGGGGGIIFNGFNLVPPIISSGLWPGIGGRGYGAGCGSRTFCNGNQGLIVIGVKIQ
jgi:formylglycine-generating enzyme required for sulfatase activity